MSPEPSGSYHNLFTRQVKGFEALGSSRSNETMITQVEVLSG